MYYVYILRLANDDLYIGSTNNLKKRISQHKSGETSSLKNHDFDLECYVAVKDEKLSRNLEKYFKSGSGRALLKKRILSTEAPKERG